MPFDYKKEYKEFYLPPKTPGIVTLPAMNFTGGAGARRPQRGARHIQAGHRHALCRGVHHQDEQDG